MGSPKVGAAVAPEGEGEGDDEGPKMTAAEVAQIEEHRQRLKLFNDAVRVSADKSLFCFPINGSGPMGRFRHWCMWHVQTQRFENTIVVLIFANVALMTLERPTLTEEANPTEYAILLFGNFGFVFAFTVEAAMKIVAWGFFCNYAEGRSAYLAGGWNRLDFFLVPRDLRVYRHSPSL